MVEASPSRVDSLEKRIEAMITQTPFGRFLCWLGLHLVIVSHSNHDAWNNGHGSTFGGCLRCNKAFQWDS